MDRKKVGLHFLSLGVLLLVSIIIFSPSAAAETTANGLDLADFEGGLPAGWFTYAGGSTVNTTTQVVADADPLARPNQVGENEILVNDFAISDYGGFGQDLVIEFGGAQDWSGYESFSFWFYGSGSGLAYQAEISDNRSDPSTDTSERFDYTFTDDTPGWQVINIPFDEFTRATDFQPGGAPDDGFTLTEIWAWAIVLPVGEDTTYFDDFALSQRIVDDFENGLPSGTDGDGVPIGFYTFQGAGSSISLSTESTPPAPELPDIGSPNNVLKVEVDSTAYAGLIHGFASEDLTTWVPQDWSKYGGMALWLYGNNSGSDLFIDLLENRNPGSTTDDAERWTVAFVDDFSGWRYIEFPFSNFVKKEVGNGSPNDGLTLEEVHGWAFGTLDTGGARIYYLDNVSLFGVAEVPELNVTFSLPEYETAEGQEAVITVKLSRELGAVEEDPAEVTVDYSIEPGTAVAERDYTPVSGTLTFTQGGPTEQSFSVSTFDNSKHDGDKTAILRLTNLVDIAPGFNTQAVLVILDDDPLDETLLDDFERGAYQWQGSGASLKAVEIAKDSPLSVPDQGDYEQILEVRSRYDIYYPVVPITGGNFKGVPPAAGSSADQIATAGDPVSFGRDFPIGQDWSRAESLSFWFYGSNSGDEITLQVKENRAPDPGPDGWSLVWSDEFNDPAGTPPNPAHWSYEVGDGAVNRIPGWGNSELQYYTSSTENSATDGSGNLVITTKEPDGSFICYYGPCKYTSARLISQYKAEFAYGRIESRILVPQGAGLWPAFWSLGTDIGEVGWPQTGEIDFMEFVGRLPNEIFGTIHGPGYSGGQSFGNVYDFGEPVFNNFHTFAIEWQPDLIEWYVDDILYHTAEPADVAPNEWVFNDPVFLLLNVAVGGNFGGPVGEETTFPQEMVIDYVHVYQGPDTAERWEASFTDDFAGWQRVTIPLAALTRSIEQPNGAPDDGLALSEVWGYGFDLPQGSSSAFLRLDQVQLDLIPPPSAITVSNLNDSGSGSLREALSLIADGGTITFDPGLNGGTITLTSGQLLIDSGVTIDAAAVAPLTISAGGSSRVIEVGAGVVVNIKDIVIRDGVAAPQGGGILNRGTLSLDRVVVTNNTENSAGPANFELGGGGIYNGDGATLNLTDSTVSNNESLNQPAGGIYGFFNSTINITRSTVSGNTSGDVAGGLRSLGNSTVVNSTFSGNTSTAWHGGGIFHTDGNLIVTNSTFAENNAPAGTASGILVATFGAPANMTLTNSVLEGNGGAFACAIEGGGAATITSGGGNVISDGSCNPGIDDLSSTDALLGLLADNGGPTLTHALGAGSPAIDAAGAGACPSTDQRGIARPQGAGCDSGAFELVP